MLIGIDPLLSGDALAVLRDMGHGDSHRFGRCQFPGALSGAAGDPDRHRSRARRPGACCR